MLPFSDLKNVIILILLLFFCSFKSPFAIGDDDFGFDSGLMESKEDRVSIKGIFYSKIVGDFYRNNKYENFGEWRNKLFLSLEYKGWKSLNFFSSFRFDYNVLLSDKDTREDYQFDIYELYLKWGKEKFDLYLGKLNLTWGMSDVSILDVVNPRDLREGIFLEEDFVKVPVTMVRLVYYFSNLIDGEFVFIPFYEPDKFDFLGTDWSVINNEILQKNETQDDLFAIDRLLSGVINPFLKDYPAKDFLHPEGGLRFTYRTFNFDYSLIIYAKYTDFPYPVFNPSYVARVQLNQGDQTTEEKLFSITPMDIVTYSRPFENEEFAVLKPKFSTMTGGGISTNIRGFGLNGEVLLTYPSYFIGENLAIVKKFTFAFGLGFDRSLLNDNIYINLFYQALYVPDFDQDLFLTERYNSAAGGLLRIKIFDRKYSAEIASIYDFTFNDFMVSSQITYSLSDNIELRGGIRLLSGKDDTPMGYFEENSGFFLTFKYNL